eukprot:snap_masked-scaffold_52-processed-gene-1.56-mRNA-1 protein AED:1.00 eAED:1.00 QI:0/-1/0/0/-1/1/1/0/156
MKIPVEETVSTATLKSKRESTQRYRKSCASETLPRLSLVIFISIIFLSVFTYGIYAIISGEHDSWFDSNEDLSNLRPTASPTISPTTLDALCNEKPVDDVNIMMCTSEITVAVCRGDGAALGGVCLTGGCPCGTGKFVLVQNPNNPCGETECLEVD